MCNNSQFSEFSYIFLIHFDLFKIVHGNGFVYYIISKSVSERYFISLTNYNDFQLGDHHFHFQNFFLTVLHKNFLEIPGKRGGVKTILREMSDNLGNSIYGKVTEVIAQLLR